MRAEQCLKVKPKMMEIATFQLYGKRTLCSKEVDISYTQKQEYILELNHICYAFSNYQVQDIIYNTLLSCNFMLVVTIEGVSRLTEFNICILP